MAGMLFVVCVPSAEREYEMVHGLPPPGGRGPLINLDGPSVARVDPVQIRGRKINPDNVPMERVLEGLLKKLEIEHVVWCADKNSSYYQVFFPIPSGDATENCLHSLAELKIGKKHNSVVSVVPCNVFMQGFDADDDEEEVDPSDKKAWDSFVDSVRAKLTVKQVVDGVRSGANVTFDYVTLILTACMVAAIGLLESSAVNIVAAMLISPLMGPVMALTFGTAIADRSLQWVGIKGLLVGGAISLVFGYIFGLLVGTTEMPWGTGSFPSDEMLGRGHYRALWLGVLWALPSGTGVALALMQGMAGVLIGVAISASLLPPIVNCGMFWGLTCIKIYYGEKMLFPYKLGDPYNKSSFEPVYSDHLPTELAINGIISFCLTLVNIGCIFITAIIVLKVKEVAAPYTSGPDLRRFWEHDIRIARDTNMSMRRSKEQRATAAPAGAPAAGRTLEYNSIPQEEMETLEVAMREAMDDDVFRKVKRCSYAHMASDLTATLGIHAPMPTSRPGSVYGGVGAAAAGTAGGGSSTGAAGLDPVLLDQLITSLLGVQAANSATTASPSAAQVTAGLSRFRPLSRSLRPGSTRRVGSLRASRGGGAGGGHAGGVAGVVTGVNGDAPSPHPVHVHPPVHPQSQPQGHVHGPVHAMLGLPTIEEGGLTARNIRRERPMSLTERALSTPAVRAVVQAVQAVQGAPQRVGQGQGQPGEGVTPEAPLLEAPPFNVRRGSTSNTDM